MQTKIIHCILFKAMTSLFNFHSPSATVAEMRDAAIQERRAKARKRKAKWRAEMSDAARQERNAKARKQMGKARAEMSDAARQTHNAKKRKQMAKVRAEMSGAARQEQNAKRRKQMAKARAEMSDAARQVYLAKARQIMALPENVRKARDRRRKIKAERSTIEPVVHRRMQNATKDDALRQRRYRRVFTR